MSDSLANPTQSNAARAPRGVFVTIQPRIEADGSIVLSDRGWRYAVRSAQTTLAAIAASITVIFVPQVKAPWYLEFVAPGFAVVMLARTLHVLWMSDRVTIDALSGTIKWTRRRGLHARYTEHPMKDVAVVSCRVQWDQGTRRDKWGQRVELGLADTSGVAIVAGHKAMLLKGSNDPNQIHAYLDTLPEPLKRLERAEPWLIAIE
ncbi:MAG: hypothetical protein KIT19_03980 [Phycisphaeraceae bacterium]|nr:hypothetical protein [Phycisphaeraceae bacterium]